MAGETSPGTPTFTNPLPGPSAWGLEMRAGFAHLAPKHGFQANAKEPDRIQRSLSLLLPPPPAGFPGLLLAEPGSLCSGRGIAWFPSRLDSSALVFSTCSACPQHPSP